MSYSKSDTQVSRSPDPVSPPAAMDRRAALGCIAVGAATFAAPAAQSAAHPDAAIFALSKRAETLSLESDEAYEAFEKLTEIIESRPTPNSLIVREHDDALLFQPGIKMGARFAREQLQEIRQHRQMFESAVNRVANAHPLLLEALARATEVDLAFRETEAVDEASGRPAARAKFEAASQALKAVWRDLALTPARTVEGVLAKFDAIAHLYSAIPPENFPKDPTADDLVEVAMSELVALRQAQAA